MPLAGQTRGWSVSARDTKITPTARGTTPRIGLPDLCAAGTYSSSPGSHWATLSVSPSRVIRALP